MAEDRMLSDEVLLALIKKNSGGGGGTTNYNNLENLPQIGGNTLVGNKTASDLGLVAAETGKGLSTNDYTDADKAIVGGVTAALANKQDKTDNSLQTTNKTVVGAVNELKSGLTNVTTLQVPPNASNKITLVRGGYVKLGRMVLVNVIVTATDDITSPNTAILWGFPSAGTNNQPLIMTEDGENTIKTTATTRMYENTLYCGFALENEKTYVISGIYNAIT